MSRGLIDDLRRMVGAASVSHSRDQLDRFGGDALGPFRAFKAASRLMASPAAVVWPTSTTDTSQVLRYAHTHHVPVVAYGGGTGVMGGATPIDGCIVLNLQRMNAVVEVRPEDRTALLQGGVILETAATALEEAGLILGHDPWSRPIATIGGAISTNGVGYTAAKYGSMGDQVLGLEVVLADGEIVRTRSVPKPSFGPSLNHLFIGSEGTLGVITEAAVHAFPVAEKRTLRGLIFPTFEHGFSAVAELYSKGVRPSLVDYEEELWRSETSRAGTTLYLGFEGFKEEVAAQDSRARAICRKFEGEDGDPAEAERFWETRHASGERYRQEVLEDPDPQTARRRRSAYRMDYLHVSLPVSKVLEYRLNCQRILGSRRVTAREWSLWGRPEFLSFLVAEDNDLGEETSPDLAEAVDAMLTLAQEMGGTMEYCHGVGIKLAHLAGNELGAGLEVVRKIKKSLDPHNILNPGKLYSTAVGVD